VRIFSKQSAEQIIGMRSTMAGEAPRMDKRGRAIQTPEPPLASIDEARRRLGASAKEARDEIESLAVAEREQLEAMMEEAVQAIEARLRGAIERRIDLEVKRVEEAGNKLRRDLKRTIRAEISKLAKASLAGDNGNGSRNRGVPIRARA
jgi:hypothetical protein